MVTDPGWDICAAIEDELEPEQTFDEWRAGLRSAGDEPGWPRNRAGRVPGLVVSSPLGAVASMHIIRSLDVYP